MPLVAGQTLAYYEILGPLGAGGAGEVYRACDTRLQREVAIKVLSSELADDPEMLQRFAREAKTLAALNHPNVAGIHGLERDGDVGFLVLELVPGEDLAQWLARGPGFDRVLDLAVQLADGLAAAHARGIVHRDLKPSNVMVTPEGSVKVLDFGMAKLVGPARDAGDEPLRTRTGAVFGTVGYMSPEQIQGRVVDARSDIFSLGIVLCELATGRRPFRGDEVGSVLAATLRDEPSFPAEFGALPVGFRELIRDCLQKDPARRPGIAAAVGERLRAVREQVVHAPETRASRRRLLVLSLGALVLALAGGWAIRELALRNRDLTRQSARLPRILQLAQERKMVEAFQLANELSATAGEDAVPSELWDQVSRLVDVRSDPSGARVRVRPLAPSAPTMDLGPTPLTAARVPLAPLHWTVELAGFQPAEFVSIDPPAGSFVLLPASAKEEDLVRVPAAEVDLWILGGLDAPSPVPLGPYLIDRHEVTNREYAEFMRAGGYERPELWTHPFEDGETTLSFEEARERFVDATGRPGPAGWRFGSFADGEGELPVSGVSWYEAAAYAGFREMELPTLYHWYHADTGGDYQLLPGLLLPTCNFDADGPRAASDACSLGAYGTHEMAGNVREWVHTAVGDGRLALGGSWSDHSYVYLFPEVLSPFDRGGTNGFRCCLPLEEESSDLGWAPLEATELRDYDQEVPVSDEVFEAFRRSFEQEPVALEPRIEATDDANEHWIRQDVSFAAGYRNERMRALLYLPRNAAPPYQAIVHMGGAGTFYRTSSASESAIFSWSSVEFLLRGGRALMIPLWKGSYERSDEFHPFESSAAVYRDRMIQWVSELRRSVDYLQTREDVDPDRIGYHGISFGALCAPVFLALEPRLRLGLLVEGGLNVMELGAGRLAPEIDPFNYAPHVTVPVLMLNGRHDPIFPYETSQLPLLRALGTSEADKRLATFPGGHSSWGWKDQLIRESLGWLDRHFGQPRGPGPGSASPAR